MINRVVLVGRLTRDIETRTTTTGKQVTEFSIAVNKRVKAPDGTDADFFRCKAWGQTAEYVSNYLSKGRLVAVDGRLEQRKYTASDGTSREVIEIVADNVQGLDRPREGGDPPSKADRPDEPTQEGGFDPFSDE